jgi:hypothetical protein
MKRLEPNVPEISAEYELNGLTQGGARKGNSNHAGVSPVTVSGTPIHKPHYIGRSLRSHPELYLVPQANAGTFGEGHLNLAIVEQIPARRLMDDQSVRLYNLNPAWGGSSVFWIDLYDRGDADEFEDQVARGFVWCERINRADHHCDLGHDGRIIRKQRT